MLCGVVFVWVGTGGYNGWAKITPAPLLPQTESGPHLVDLSVALIATATSN